MQTLTSLVFIEYMDTQKEMHATFYTIYVQ